MFGAGRRRDLVGVRPPGVGSDDPQGTSANDLDAAGDDRAVEQLHAAAGTGNLGVHRKRPDRHRSV